MLLTAGVLLNMNVACPISDRRLNETAVRLVAFMVFLAAIIACFGFLPLIAAALALDFFIRAFTTWPISYLSALAKLITRILKLPSKPINAGPKIFAARLGFVLATTISILGFMHLTIPAVALAGVLALFAALESFFSICVGCHIYSLLMKLRSGNKTSGGNVQ
jgi:hypothetical protein